jgi:1,2-diacylglycerol 3-alpha-glucosyltransferase
MRIGIVTTWFERGAAYVSRMFMETLSKNHIVYIYARGGEEYAVGDPTWDNENVTWGKHVNCQSPNPVNWKDFYNWVKSNHLEVIIFNEQRDWDVILKCAWLLPNTRIGAYIDYYTATTIPFFKLYDFVICNTKRHFEIFKSHPQSVYIPWGTNVEIYKPINRTKKHNHIIFFHSCGMNYVRKGTDLLVEAFKLLEGESLLIIHSQKVIQDQDLRERILKNPKIQLIEKTVGIPGLYNEGDIYVYPSRLDGIGLTIAEALSSGLPVITTDEAPMNEFVKHGINGRLVKVIRQFSRDDNYFWPVSECDVNSLANAMQFYIDNILKLGFFQQTARDYAITKLSWKNNSHFFSDWIEKTSFSRKRLNIIEIVKILRYDFYLNWGSIDNYIKFMLKKVFQEISFH